MKEVSSICESEWSSLDFGISPDYLSLLQDILSVSNSYASSHSPLFWMPPKMTALCPNAAALWCEIFPGTVPFYWITSHCTPVSPCCARSYNYPKWILHMVEIGPTFISLPPWMYRLQKMDLIWIWCFWIIEPIWSFNGYLLLVDYKTAVIWSSFREFTLKSHFTPLVVL